MTTQTIASCGECMTDFCNRIVERQLEMTKVEHCRKTVEREEEGKHNIHVLNA